MWLFIFLGLLNVIVVLYSLLSESNDSRFDDDKLPYRS
jgi:hypothetical protein